MIIYFRFERSGLTNGIGINISQIRLELGEIANDYEIEDVSSELIRCQRYCQPFMIAGKDYSTALTQCKTNQGSIDFKLPVTMMTTPTLLITNIGAIGRLVYGNDSIITIADSNLKLFSTGCDNTRVTFTIDFTGTPTTYPTFDTLGCTRDILLEAEI
jgi:hypothetical protein